MRYPLSFAQEWALSRPAVLSHATWLDGPVDPAALRRAMDVVVARHPVLRTHVTASGEQVVSETGRVVLEHVVLPGDVARAESTAAELAERPFDLSREPLARAAVIEVGAGRWLFALVAHRVVADASTLAMLLADLSTVYRGGLSELPPSWMDYGDYAVWQRERLRGEELARQLAHWREVLRDAPAPVRLPAGHRAASLTAVADPTAVRRLAAVAEGTGATLLAAFLAAYAVVLSRYAGRADVVVGAPVSGRTRVELEPIAGPFADVVPVRVPLAGEPSFAELLVRVRDAAAQAVSHDEVPLGVLVEELGVGLSDAVRFTFPPPATPALDLPGVTVRSRVALSDAATADLDLRVDEHGALTLEHRTDPGFADWVLRSVVAVLEHATADSAVSELPVPAPEDTWSAVVEPSPAEPSPNGAVRSAAAEAAEPEADVSPVPARGEIEQAMAKTWADLLRRPGRVGVRDNLFGLGGGSLAAVRFASIVADTYGVTLPLPLIFASPTVAALAEFVSAELEAARAARDVEADQAARLARLSDDELDDLLRAVVATRERRRSTGGDGR
ncbi:condensation domain-containing protein [Saccharothrix texasensis]|uniref:Phosphopantetheine binding protein n=1 Tax=Saccharothrix texasensis TaxID=103734 RepID=A0A3N1GY42_9PSEU|nr:condensation domain-containing protein [Saccharothrix texasensis]ROP35026.1 phosphopantetheine binding protein [Saccharothrix texasensis]